MIIDEVQDAETLRERCLQWGANGEMPLCDLRYQMGGRPGDPYGWQNGRIAKALVQALKTNRVTAVDGLGGWIIKAVLP